MKCYREFEKFRQAKKDEEDPDDPENGDIAKGKILPHERSNALQTDQASSTIDASVTQQEVKFTAQREGTRSRSSSASSI
jgi:hypothetical protein